MDGILLENVTFRYGEEKQTVLENIDLFIGKGEFVTILGANGSGKSTLSSLMNGIVLPTEGRVTVDGMDVTDESKILDIRKKVGHVFQDPDNQIVSSVVEEDVAFGPENLGIPQQEIQERVTDALSEVGMLDYRLKSTYDLSGGQKQRIAIAGILAMHPDYIVLDEPTAMLDPDGRKTVLEIVKDINRRGVTIILITHFMDEVIMSDRTVVLSKGHVVKTGTPREILTDTELLEKNNLEAPTAARLAALLREKGAELGGSIMTKEEFVKEFDKL